MTPTTIMPRSDQDFEAILLANVRAHGCHINYVGGEPPFAYSVGFPETVGQPEVIVFGLALEVAQFLINELLRQCRAGLVLEDGLVVRGLLRDHACVALLVPPEKITPDYFNSAIWYQRRSTGTAMAAAFQIIWPGVADGLFPWDEGCDEMTIALQAPLTRQERSA